MEYLITSGRSWHKWCFARPHFSCCKSTSHRIASTNSRRICWESCSSCSWLDPCWALKRRKRKQWDLKLKSTWRRNKTYNPRGSSSFSERPLRDTMRKGTCRSFLQPCSLAIQTPWKHIHVCPWIIIRWRACSADWWAGAVTVLNSAKQFLKRAQQ